MIEVELWCGAGLVTCLADDRVQEAVLAERARVNGWWQKWNRDPGDYGGELRDAGIASGAQPPGGEK